MHLAKNAASFARSPKKDDKGKDSFSLTVFLLKLQYHTLKTFDVIDQSEET